MECRVIDLGPEMGLKLYEQEMMRIYTELRIKRAARELLNALKEAVKEHPLPKQAWLDLIEKAEGR